MTKCKRLLYKLYPQQDQPYILLGLIVSEDSNLLTFKTAKRQISIAKSCIIALEDTSEEFREAIQ